ncbi:MAG: helix-turn-helix domain-containing protein [Actinomycetota bacterium]
MADGEDVRRIRERAGLTQRELAQRSGVAQPNIAAYERGTRRPSATMLTRLRETAKPRPSTALAAHRSEVEAILRQHKALGASVFGSVARGEDRSGSDLDLLVVFRPDASLFDQVELEHDLQQLLGVDVDVVSDAGLLERHRRIREQAVPL